MKFMFFCKKLRGKFSRVRGAGKILDVREAAMVELQSKGRHARMESPHGNMAGWQYACRTVLAAETRHRDGCGTFEFAHKPTHTLNRVVDVVVYL